MNPYYVSTMNYLELSLKIPIGRTWAMTNFCQDPVHFNDQLGNVTS